MALLGAVSDVLQTSSTFVLIPQRCGTLVAEYDAARGAPCAQGLGSRLCPQSLHSRSVLGDSRSWAVVCHIFVDVRARRSGCVCVCVCVCVCEHTCGWVEDHTETLEPMCQVAAAHTTREYTTRRLAEWLRQVTHTVQVFWECEQDQGP